MFRSLVYFLYSNLITTKSSEIEEDHLCKRIPFLKALSITLKKLYKEMILTLFTVDANEQGLTDTPVSSYFVHTCSMHTRGAGTLVNICRILMRFKNQCKYNPFT